MKTVRDILSAKGSVVYSIEPGVSVIAALELMAAKNIGAILVAPKGGAIEGIFSERDFARKIILKGYDCEHSLVKDMMTQDVTFVNPDTPLVDCMNLMTMHHFRHLPVKSGDTTVGLVSIGDVVKTLIQDQERIIAEQAFEIGQNERRTPGAV